MNDKEIILSKIAEVVSRPVFFIKNNSEFKARLKCLGLNDLYEKYIDYLVPYFYNQGYVHKFEINNEEYDVFLGLDSIFSDLYKENRHEDIINRLKEITKSFNVRYISEECDEDFEELAKLYEILGLSITIEFDKVKVSACMESDFANSYNKKWNGKFLSMGRALQSESAEEIWRRNESIKSYNLF